MDTAAQEHQTAPQRLEKPDTFFSIQILRAVAALLVVQFHIESQVGRIPTPLNPDGFLHYPTALKGGVDLFFVISGFVMVISTAGRDISTWAFLKARLERIIPPYWTWTAVLVGITYLTSSQWPTTKEIVLSALLVPYDNANDGLPLLGPGWTLTYEMFFYILFGALLSITARNRFVVLTILFVTLVACRPLLAPLGQAGFRLTSPLLFEFLIGMAIALSLPRLQQLPKAIAIAALLAALPLGLIFNFLAPTAPRFIIHGIPSVLLVVGALNFERNLRAPIYAPARLLGDASYSLYLTHIIILAPLLGILSGFPFWAVSIAGIVATSTFSIVIFLGYEKPLLKALRRRFHHPRPRSAPLEN